MGQAFAFTCTGCKYEVSVAGGGDSGMMVMTTTIVCLDCKELMDIPFMEVPRPGQERLVRIPLRCSRNKRHGISIWEEGEECPRCGGQMEKGHSAFLWD